MSRRSPPPLEFRYRPGQSGNPKGRPKGSKNKKTKMRTPALDESVRYPVNGVLRRMSRREAIIRYAQARVLTHRDPKLRSLLLEFDRQLSKAQAAINYEPALLIIPTGHWMPEIKNIEGIMVRLGLGRLMYRGHPAQRVELDPALVSEAVSRLGADELSRDEQKLAVAFTITPKKVQWPDWWDEGLRTRKCRLPKRMLAADEAEWKRMFTPPPPPPPTPPDPDKEFARMLANEPEYICKTTGVVQTVPCPDCVKKKKERKSECFYLPQGTDA